MPREKPRGVQLRSEALDVTPLQWAHLSDEWSPGEPMPDDSSGLEVYAWGQGTLLHLREAWARSRAHVLPQWIARRPGTRPRAWWAFDAPRWEDPWHGTFYHGALEAPRRRVGGVGDPDFEVLNVVPRLVSGIPGQFVTDHWAGREPWNRVHKRPAMPFCAGDPPLYESEASYLKRLGFLTDQEAAVLPREAFNPVPVSSCARGLAR